jgi:hypothetical protein
VGQVELTEDNYTFILKVIIDDLKKSRNSREKALAITKLEEARFWLIQHVEPLSKEG